MAVECQHVEGVYIDQHEITALADMIKEAAIEEQAQIKNRPKNSVQMGAYTRESINMLTGDENDLLSDAPVFERPIKQDKGSEKIN